MSSVGWARKEREKETNGREKLQVVNVPKAQEGMSDVI